jgi:HSP20 family protein
VSAPHWHADIEVGEAEDGWVMSARLPGFEPDDIHLHVTARELTIEAVRPGDEPTSEFAYRLAVPPDADPDAIDASMHGDLLAVRIPRLPARGPRRVSVRRYEVDSPDGSAADESVLGPSPGSVVPPPG